RTIRNRATVGGSVANGYPLGHLVCVAICLEAKMCLVSDKGERVLDAREFFLSAMVTDIAPGEILREVRFPAAKPDDRSHFMQLANHPGGAAICMLASHLSPGVAEQTRLHFCLAGACDVPIRLRGVEALLFATSEITNALASDFSLAGYDDHHASEHQKYAR